LGILIQVLNHAFSPSSWAIALITSYFLFSIPVLPPAQLM
jgi:hypothetical protein